MIHGQPPFNLDSGHDLLQGIAARDGSPTTWTIPNSPTYCAAFIFIAIENRLTRCKQASIWSQIGLVLATSLDWHVVVRVAWGIDNGVEAEPLYILISPTAV